MRAVMLTLFLLISTNIGVGQNLTCTPPPSGMVGWWPGDGNTNDIVGSSNGSLVGGTTFAPGKVGQAFSINGPNGDAVQIPNSSSLLLGTGEITIEAWIKTLPTNIVQAIVAKSNPSYPGQGYFLRVHDDQRAEFAATDCGTPACGWGDNSGVKQAVRSVSIVADGTFHHIAGLRRSNGVREIYVDGVMENSRSEAMWNTDSGNALYLGQLDVIVDDPYNGLIDEATLYNRALSASEIQSIFNAGSAGKCKYASQVQPPINADGSSVFNSHRGVVPVKFTLALDNISTCQLPAATIALFQTYGAAPGPVNESVFTTNADTGSNFRIDGCQYIYNLGTDSLGAGTYLVQIAINGLPVGTGTFGLQ